MTDEELSAHCEELTEQGLAAYREERFEASIEIAGKLRDLKYSSGFEIEALALNGMGRTEEAVAVLREGVGKAPTVWLLWQLLGNYESDLGQYDSSAERYAKALECECVDVSSVRFNQAILATRLNKMDAAVEALKHVDERRLALAKAAILVQVKTENGDYSAAEDEGLAALNALADDPDLFDSFWYGELVSRSVKASLADGDSPEECRAVWLQSLIIDPSNESILRAIRELDSLPAKGARWFRLLIDAVAVEPETDGPDGFVVSCEVLARDVEHGLEFFLLSTPEISEYEFTVDESEEQDWEPAEHAGVYRLSDRQYYFDGEDDT